MNNLSAAVDAAKDAGDAFGLELTTHDLEKLLEAAAPILLKNMRPMSLVEIEERDNPELMKAARDRVRAERRVAKHAAYRAAKAEALREAADRWLQGEWANAPRRTDRSQERIANGQHVGDWLRNRAAELEAHS